MRLAAFFVLLAIPQAVAWWLGVFDWIAFPDVFGPMLLALLLSIPLAAHLSSKCCLHRGRVASQVSQRLAATLAAWGGRYLSWRFWRVKYAKRTIPEPRMLHDINAVNRTRARP